jgi:hypothetical protein
VQDRSFCESNADVARNFILYLRCKSNDKPPNLLKMAPDSKALTTEVESGSPYQLDTNQVGLLILQTSESTRRALS